MYGISGSCRAFQERAEGRCGPRYDSGLSLSVQCAMVVRLTEVMSNGIGREFMSGPCLPMIIALRPGRWSRFAHGTARRVPGVTVADMDIETSNLENRVPRRGRGVGMGIYPLCWHRTSLHVSFPIVIYVPVCVRSRCQARYHIELFVICHSEQSATFAQVIGTCTICIRSFRPAIVDETHSGGRINPIRP